MLQNFLAVVPLFVMSEASAGTLGPTINTLYGTNGTAHISIDAGGDNNDFPATATLLADGSLVVAGQSDIAKGGSFDGDLHQAALAKFAPSGSPDTTFGPLNNGHVVLSIVPPGGDGGINSVSRTSEGELLVVGIDKVTDAEYGGTVSDD